ncbi:MAG: NAD(P)-dependent glycerol-3-phosphate dehydrogenase [Syntrophomonadaceae bacterium]|jgi:glycerol-3-phosphate dehydrogenase (NAD(P)+)|nr:NAD(P)-dependent glycerol-3-phosphate dehydrogenase [Syntrophomonadaceae bacterium]
MGEKVCIVGAGSWGTAQAVLLSDKADEIALWGRPQDGIELMAATRENKRFLPGVKINANINPTADMEAAAAGSDYIIIAVPAQTVREVLEIIKAYYIPGTLLVNTAKGLEISTAKRLSQVMVDVLGSEIKPYLACLSGPSHAEEVGRGLLTAVTVSALQKDTAQKVQRLYMNGQFRVYTNPDLTGVELGGAVKNIVALCAGILEGLGYGDNIRAALITRGLHEISKLGAALGAKPLTFVGLSGLGDLVATCYSAFSRNRKAGELIGRGYSTDEALREVGMIVEGVYSCPVAYRLAMEMRVDMPIVRACYNILEQKKTPQQEIDALMKRDMRPEGELWGAE